MNRLWDKKDAHSAPAQHIVRRVFRDYPGSLSVHLWDGEVLVFGGANPSLTLVFHGPAAFRNLILSRDPLHLAEAYFQGRIDVKGNLYDSLKLKDHLESLRLSISEKMAFLLSVLFLRDKVSVTVHEKATKRKPWIQRLRRNHTKSANRQAIAFHYDVSNTFYKLWLDPQMIYSCAYFKAADDSLKLAQSNKLTHICRKLRLKQGEHLLDIGCGWGALICWAARRYGVHAHGITLSREQYDYAQQRILDEGLQDKVTVELRDYRDLKGISIYDKVVSVGMFEHVGLKNLPAYFTVVQRLLKPGGLFLNHGITQDVEGWGKTVGAHFINRYVFPDGELDMVSNVQRAMERTDFEIVDVESLRAHYALTLRHWVRRLEANKADALKHVTESVYRVWHLYMVACALQFEQGDIGVYQILAIKRDGGDTAMPLTRDDLYN